MERKFKNYLATKKALLKRIEELQSDIVNLNYEIKVRDDSITLLKEKNDKLEFTNLALKNDNDKLKADNKELKKKMKGNK